jgi:threonine dehydrogenase-like Zn-dependent dehydrogenase
MQSTQGARAHLSAAEISMFALSVTPGVGNSANLDEITGPVGDLEGILVRPLCVGMCGTDAEIVRGEYGWAPPGRSRLVLGHECVARVEKADQGFDSGEFVVPIVRRPDPQPCSSCAVGEWDMCRNGKYTEHGIKQLDGFCAEQLRIHPDFLVRVPALLGRRAVLIEPASVVAKAWEQIERIGKRTHWEPRRVLVTGAGPVGLLATLLARQRGFEVRVFDRSASGIKPELASRIGANYSHGDLGELLRHEPPDIVLECTGADAVVLDVMRSNAPGAVTCLVGVSAAGRRVPVDVGSLNRILVLENDVVFGSVNANRRHYEQAAAALAAADPAWLDALITRRVRWDVWKSALHREVEDVKVVIELA